MDTSSQYSSCETLDSHRSSEYDEKNEVNGNDSQRQGRKVRKLSSPHQSLLTEIVVQISVEHVEYIQKERVTRAAPPKPAYNPMQFVAIKPSNLFQTAQEQLKKAEEVRKVKEVNRKEEPEDWQNVSYASDSCQQVKVSRLDEPPIELVKELELMHRAVKNFLFSRFV